ncbi:ATP-binding protein [Variovorax ureilyticus]|uniref:histidine kinase n=1 Tax=Variovorax ureilyticus TaxID=1836198 RepID=A0ABU8VB01_9BURK
MSWITVIWSMVAAACLTLAGVLLPVWIRDRTARPYLFFALMAVATTGFVFCDLRMIQAQTPEEFAAALKWVHVPIWFLLVALVAFVRVYLKAGRLWLAWSAIGLRTIALLLDFTTGQNLNYNEITDLRRVAFLGELVSVPVGVPNPWMLVGQLGVLLILIYVADASITAWRRGNRRTALRVGGILAFLLLVAAGQSALLFWGVIKAPTTLKLVYPGIIVLIGYEVSREVLRASQLVHALREGEQRMNLAAEAADVGIWVRDFARNDFWASAKWRELFGFALTQAVDLERMLLKLHPDDRDVVRQALAKAVADGGEYTSEFRLVLADGRIRWIAAQGRVDLDTSRRPIRMRGACTDCTARKQAEREMLQLRHEIVHAGRVSVMGQFASALAHEISQPLGAIQRNAEAASIILETRSPDLDEIRAIVDDILSDDQRAGAVIDRMRALLRRREIDMQPLHVGELLGDVAALSRPDAAARQVSLVLEIADDVPPVLGDRVHLQQVLLNLISNGMDSIEEAGRKVRRIAVTAVLDGARAVEIAVADNGVGIPPDRLEQVFSSFFTTKATGMGMGLSISRTLVETHGGRLWAENLDDGGARLRFTLPVAPEVATELAAA